MPAVPSPRPALDPTALSDVAGPRWSVEVLTQTGSTNAVAAENPAHGRVVVAEHQSAGRGRLDREWVAPPGSALTFSIVVDPGIPDEIWPLVSLAAGLAVMRGVRRCADVGAVLKWPNDVLIGRDKLGGILVERVRGPLAVIGIGVNVSQTQAELPVPQATSLELAGSTTGRVEVFAAILEALEEGLGELRRDPVGVLNSYRDECSTIGSQVEVSLPSGEHLTGVATTVDDSGRLVVQGRAVGAGDVVHVRAGQKPKT